MCFIGLENSKMKALFLIRLGTVSTRAALTKILTSIIFRASAFHAVQNNAQFDYFGFVPNKPLVSNTLFSVLFGFEGPVQKENKAK